MADRYQDRAYGAGHGRGGDQYGSDRGENDPLAELARLIGQTDPFGNMGKAGGQASQRPAAPRQETRQDYYDAEEYEQQAPEPEAPPAPAGPPTWIQRANIRREPPRGAPREAARDFPRERPRDVPRQLPPEPAPEHEDYPGAAHPLHRYAPQPQPQAYQSPHSGGYYQEQPAYQQPAAYQHEPQAYAEDGQEVDPSRYDDALYGQLEDGLRDLQREPAYPDDPYAYQGEYDDEMDEPQQKRRGIPLKVAAVLALAVFGLAAAYGYHSYFGDVPSGDIPIIKADNSPTKIIPQQSDAAAKLPDRMVTGDGTEKIVPREEQPVDVNSQNVAPRVVFPPLNPNANPPSVASVAPTAAMPPAPAGVAPGAAAGNSGTLPNGEPRKIKTFSVKGDQPDPSAVPVNPPQPAAPSTVPAKNAKPPKTSPSNANASANGPLSLSPQAQPAAPEDTGTQLASTNPSQIESSAPAASGSFLVPITSQPSEAEARASFRAMQGKYPSVLGSQTAVITRANSKSGSVMYRGSVGPFTTQAEASEFCHKYEAAGGQCWVFKN